MAYSLLAFADVMKNIFGVVLAVIILLAMVTIHEFGHYLVGRWLGFKINEFSVGFGPALYKKRSKKTGEIFALRVIPLGGYCAFDGEDEEETPKDVKTAPEEPFAEEFSSDATMETEQKTENGGSRVASTEEEEYPEPKGVRFNDQPPWKRILVLIAGATMNYLLALLLIIVMFAGFGRPMYETVKKEPGEDADAHAVQTYEEGLQNGDVILEINGKKMYLITDYIKVLDGKKKGDTVQVLVLRGEKQETVDLVLAEDADFVNSSDTGTLIFSMGLASRGEVDGKIETTRGGGLHSYSIREGFFETIGNSVVYSFKMGGVILRTLGELLTGKLGLEAMGGPITTISVTAQVATSGVTSFLNMAALIGVNLAVFNLLPIPALDGCKVIFCLIEWIRKKPVNRKVEAIIHFIGIIFLFGFAILVDLLQLF